MIDLTAAEPLKPKHFGGGCSEFKLAEVMKLKFRCKDKDCGLIYCLKLLFESEPICKGFCDLTVNSKMENSLICRKCLSVFKIFFDLKDQNPGVAKYYILDLRQMINSIDKDIACSGIGGGAIKNRFYLYQDAVECGSLLEKWLQDFQL